MRDRDKTQKMIEILMGMKPTIDQFHAERNGRKSSYPVGIRKAVSEAMQEGVSVSEISKLLEIKGSTVTNWRRSLLPKRDSSSKKLKRIKRGMRELRVVGDERGIEERGIRIHFPKQILLELPVGAMSLEMWKSLL